VQSLLVLRKFLNTAAPAARGPSHAPQPATTSSSIGASSNVELLPAPASVKAWQPLQEELLKFILGSWEDWGDARASAKMMVEGAWRSGLSPAEVREEGGSRGAGGRGPEGANWGTMRGLVQDSERTV
jgi:hypothetical protein